MIYDCLCPFLMHDIEFSALAILFNQSNEIKYKHKKGENIIFCKKKTKKNALAYLVDVCSLCRHFCGNDAIQTFVVRF